MNEFIELMKPIKNRIGWFVPTYESNHTFLTIHGRTLADDTTSPDPFKEFYFDSELSAHKAISDYYTLHHQVNPFSDDFLELVLAPFEDNYVGSRVLEL